VKKLQCHCPAQVHMKHSLCTQLYLQTFLFDVIHNHMFLFLVVFCVQGKVLKVCMIKTLAIMLALSFISRSLPFRPSFSRSMATKRIILKASASLKKQLVEEDEKLFGVMDFKERNKVGKFISGNY